MIVWRRLRGGASLPCGRSSLVAFVFIGAWFAALVYLIVTTGHSTPFHDVRSTIPGALTVDDVTASGDDVGTSGDSAARQTATAVNLTAKSNFIFEVSRTKDYEYSFDEGRQGEAFDPGDESNPEGDQRQGYPGDFLTNAKTMSAAPGGIAVDRWRQTQSLNDYDAISIGGTQTPDEVGNWPKGNKTDQIPTTELNRVKDLDLKPFSLRVTSEMIDNFQVKLPPLLEHYKNPCWLEELPRDFSYEDSYYNKCRPISQSKHSKQIRKLEMFQQLVLQQRVTLGSGWRIRCFPYFFLLGVGKCGTTDVFMTLKMYSKHLAPAILKEPHFWEWKRCYGKTQCEGKPRNPTFADYLDTLDPGSEIIRQVKITLDNGTEYHPLIIGDFTPSTLTFHPCWTNSPGNERRKEPLYVTPHYIHSIRPQTKFIVIMRDPVERIFSNYKMKFRLKSRQDKESAQMFHDQMLNATTYFTTCMKQDSARACAYSVMRFDFMTHVSNSMYEIFIRDWLAVFPRDQFLFLRMEDYMENRVPSIRAIFKFLGLEDLSPAQEQDIAEKQITNKAQRTILMFDETKALLRAFFRPFNRRLADLLQNEGFTWGY